MIAPCYRVAPDMATGWSMPRLWPGSTVFVLGGGPSLGLIEPSTLRRPCIAVNNAYLLKPDADVLYFADRRWHEWNRHDLHRYVGEHVVSRVFIPPRERVPGGPDIRWLNRDHNAPVSHDPRFVAGFCGGANAVNLAYLGGARRIVLLGFDMRPGNWHRLHKLPPVRHQHRESFIPSLTRMGRELAKVGVEVVNATPGSALTAFPIVSPERFGMELRPGT